MTPALAASAIQTGPVKGLFKVGQDGALYDPRILASLFQDSAGTQPVTAVGQSVGLMLDQSGKGHHMAQATAGLKPLYKLDTTGRPYLEFDGVDDEMTTTSYTGPTGSNPSSMAVAVRYRGASGQLRRTMIRGPGGTRTNRTLESDTGQKWSIGCQTDSLAMTQSVTANGKNFVIGTWSGNSLEGWVGGNVGQTKTMAANAATTGTELRLARVSSVAVWSNIDFFGGMEMPARRITAAEVAVIRGFLAQQIGVALL